MVRGAPNQSIGRGGTLARADFLTASRLGDASQQNLVAAHELARKHGEVVRQRNNLTGFPWLDVPSVD
jgi:hypothetical protein